MSPVTPPEPRPLELEILRNKLVDAMPWYDESDPDYSEVDAILAAALTPAAEAGSEPGLDVERLAEAAYRDRPPNGSRPVPWTPVKRREWRAWAGRIQAALREPRS